MKNKNKAKKQERQSTLTIKATKILHYREKVARHPIKLNSIKGENVLVMNFKTKFNFATKTPRLIFKHKIKHCPKQIKTLINCLIQ
jgi:hypothetical protein